MQKSTNSLILSPSISLPLFSVGPFNLSVHSFTLSLLQINENLCYSFARMSCGHTKRDRKLSLMSYLLLAKRFFILSVTGQIRMAGSFVTNKSCFGSFCTNWSVKLPVPLYNFHEESNVGKFQARWMAKRISKKIPNPPSLFASLTFTYVIYVKLMIITTISIYYFVNMCERVWNWPAHTELGADNRYNYYFLH